MGYGISKNWRGRPTCYCKRDGLAIHSERCAHRGKPVNYARASVYSSGRERSMESYEAELESRAAAREEYYAHGDGL
jgi:hypothetical protein